MSASHHPTDIHLRQHRAKKRDKMRARIATTPASGRAALEVKVQRTYSHSTGASRQLFLDGQGAGPRAFGTWVLL